jgi:predicted RNase H-like HicB family nuclease
MRKFTGVFFREGKWWVAFAEELPGANTQGRTLQEARQNLKEAITLILKANRDLARQEERGKRVKREVLEVGPA